MNWHGVNISSVAYQMQVGLWSLGGAVLAICLGWSITGIVLNLKSVPVESWIDLAIVAASECPKRVIG